MKKTASLIVTFYEASEKEINKFLKENDVFGVSVSSMFNRWSIEVPFWREQDFINKFSEHELVKSVHPYIDYSRKQS